jgi:type IV pilus assembly protein PilN
LWLGHAEVLAVILINLLPHREERRKRREKAFIAGLVVAAALGLAVVGVWYLILQQMIAGQQQRNSFLTSEIQKLEVQIKDIASLRSDIESLKARQKAVEDLQIDRNVPVYLLNELVRQTPEGIYFTSVKQDGQVLTVSGIAQTNERVSELLRNTNNNSPWLVKPELIEIKVATVQASSRDQRRLFDFSMKVSVKRPQDQVAAPEGGASAPTPPAAPVAANKV